MKLKICLFFLSISSFLYYACKEESLQRKKSSDCIVNYKGNCITKQTLEEITRNLSYKDSAITAQKYIQQWQLQQRLYEKAKQSIDLDEHQLQEYLEDIKRQYVISEYLKIFLKQYLDTIVTKKEIIDYYQQNKEAFKLTNNIVRIFYVKLNDNERDINEFKKLLSSPKDKNKLTSFILEKANSYFIDDSLWLKWSDVTKEIPALKNYDFASLSSGKVTEWKDGTYYYYIKIKDHKAKDEYSPIIYEQQKIKKNILDIRKNILIDSLKRSMLMQSNDLNQKK